MSGQAISAVGARVWDSAWQAVPLLRRYAPVRAALEARAAALMRAKTWVPVRGARFGNARRARIAWLMALPVVGLDLRWYRGFASVLVYPTVFLAHEHETDDAGVVHERREWRGGQTEAGGPLVLALPEVAASGRGGGYNVVIHECAHQLDLLGTGTGMPPLHRDMSRAAWARAFTAAFAHFTDAVETGARTALDPYAAQAPEEFFAVASEAFFETPRALRRTYPQVYAQLALFYRLDPLRL